VASRANERSQPWILRDAAIIHGAAGGGEGAALRGVGPQRAGRLLDVL
jgi:hypothetical protein